MRNLTVKFTYEDEQGEEQEVELPAKNVVCHRCEGYGTHLNPSIGQHAYTSEEFNESFDEEEAEQYFTRGGIYDVSCEECHGNKVIAEVDEQACDPALLKRYQDHQNYLAESRAEDRYTAWMEGGYLEG